MRERVTNESKNNTLVCGSWKYVWWHCLSKSERDAYPLVSLPLAAYVTENLPERGLKVIPRYTYDPTTSTGLWERMRWHLVLTREDVWKIRTLVFSRFTTNPRCVQRSSKALRCFGRLCSDSESKTNWMSIESDSKIYIWCNYLNCSMREDYVTFSPNLSRYVKDKDFSFL